MSSDLPKIIAIVAPTASGKSSLAVDVAKKFNGEIVSADSRQIYKGLDIGTGKVTSEEMKNIPHHLLDIIEAGESFSVALYKEKAEEVIDDILDRGKLPILEGGTGFYIEAIVYGTVLPDVKPDSKLREELQDKNETDLFKILEKVDPNRAGDIDKNNKRRLVRAIEIAKHRGKVPEVKTNPKYNALQIGLRLPADELRKRIEARVRERLEDGWVNEVNKLLDDGVPQSKLSEFGLGYKIISDYLTDNPQPTTDKEKLVEKIATAEWRYAKRQMTWFSAKGGSASGGKRDKEIKWFDPNEKEKILREIENFLASRV